MVKKTYKIIVHFYTGENIVVAVSRYKGYAELLAKWIDDYYRLKKEVMSFAVVVKGGIVQQIGKGVVSRPETCFSGQPTKWAKDIYKKGHGPVPEVE